MAEVFTISGALGDATASAPAQLQNALKALGVMAGDPTLIKVTVDGIIGPATVKAVNYAIANVTGPLPNFQKPNLNVTNVRQYAGGIASTLTAYIKQRGGTVPPPSVTRAKGGGGHASAADRAAAQKAVAQPHSLTEFLDTHPNLVWWGLGGAGIVIVLGFMAQHRRRAAQQARVPASA